MACCSVWLMASAHYVAVLPQLVLKNIFSDYPEGKKSPFTTAKFT
jgi:hypothetical protein